MGARGPVPKPDGQRRRRNKPVGGPAEKASAGGEPIVPDPDEGWHKVARIVWDSLASSGQAQFYTSSDWATAYALCESMSREFKPQPMRVGVGDDARVEMVELPPKGASLAAWSKTMGQLMMTEGDRRRARLELEKPVGGKEGSGAGGSVAWLDAARRGRAG